MALSQKEFDTLKSRLSGQPVSSTPTPETPASTVAPVNTQPVNHPLDGLGISDRIKADFTKRNQSIIDSKAKVAAGTQSLPVSLLHAVGQTAGLITDVGSEVVKSAAQTGFEALPKHIQDSVKTGATSAAKYIAGTGAGKLGIEALQSGAEAYSSFEKAHPDVAQALGDVFNVAGIIPIGKVTKVGAEAAAEAAKIAASKTVKTAAEIAAEAAAGVNKTINGGKNIVAKASDIVTPIEKGVETVLDPTSIIPKENLKDIPIEKIVSQQATKSQKLDAYVKQAEKAVNDFSQPTPLAIAGEKAGHALNILSNKLSKQGQIMQAALEKSGEKIVPEIGSIRAKLRDSLRERIGVNIITDDNGLRIVPAAGRASKVAFDNADNKLMTDAYAVLASLGNKPTLRQVDDTVDALQDLLYKRKSAVAVPVNGQVEGVLKSITGQLNSTARKLGGESYRKANDKFSHFVGIRDSLNKALGAEGVRGASLMKQLFSPTGEAPRRLFQQIKDLTGIDLVEEATLAKFVMEQVGDARQASLLEEVINSGSVSPKSFVGTAANNVIKRLQNPLGKAQRIIKRPTK